MDPEQLNNFWRLVQDVWQNGYAGIDFGRYFSALFIFIIFLMFRRLFTRIILNRLEGFVQNTNTDIDERLLIALKNPIRFIPIVIGFFIATEYLNLSGDIKIVMENLTRSLVIFTIFWALHRTANQFSFLFLKSNRLNNKVHGALLSWISNIIKLFMIIIGLAAVLEVWGIDVGTLIAGLGLFGVAVALGAQDMFKNLIAGMLIIAENRFQHGHWIKVDGVIEGTVENIGFRSTRVRRFDQAPVTVPNSALSDNPVTNFSEMKYRRIYWVLGVEYSTSVDQLKQIRDGIEALVINNPQFVTADKASTFVRIDNFNASSIDIMLYCFTNTTNWGEWLAIKEQLAFDIKEVVEGAGSGFAFPSTSLYVEKMPSAFGDPETPETLTPSPAKASAQQSTKNTGNAVGAISATFEGSDGE